MVEYDFTFKVLLVAAKDYGKTELIRYLALYLGQKHQISPPDLIFSSKTMNFFGIISKLQLWIYSNDDERFKFLIPQYFMGCIGVILMYDITDVNSLKYIFQILQQVKKIRETHDYPILLVGNKSDLKENRKISKEQIKKFKIEHKISKTMEINIKTGENIEKMFQRITRMAIKNTSGIEIKRLRRIERRRESPYIKIDAPYRRIETPLKSKKSKGRFKSNRRKWKR